LQDLPPFCRVAAILRPSVDSEIRVEVWLPRAGWNGRLLGTGNGGSAGRILPNVLAAGLRRHYAVANTDLGTGPDAELCIGRPERWADFGHRATHEMTLAAKAIVQAYYGSAPRRSYFIGASTGGQQALSEAQRYPGDYDGIIAGSPVINRTHLHAMFVWNWQAVHATADSAFTPAAVAAVTSAVVSANAGRAGGAPGEGFLNDPRDFHFDPATLQSGGADHSGATTLTTAQIAALQRIYAGPVDPHTGARIFVAPPAGSEASMYLAVEDPARPPAHSYLLRWVLGKDFDFRRFDFAKDLMAVDAALSPLVNATSPELEAFRERGGKLIAYCGTADAITPFGDAIRYYEDVVAAQGGLPRTLDFFRLFLVPGMAHGGNGPGPGDFGQRLPVGGEFSPSDDILTALERWVEQGIAPEQLIATAYVDGEPARGVRAQRPVFPYPQFPHYRGGDAGKPESFVAREHSRGVGFPTKAVSIP
jgi:feruloyl esterase